VTDEARWTNALQPLFGYQEGDVGLDAAWWYDHIQAEDRERVVSGIQALINSGKQFWSDEYRFRRRDGSSAYILDRGYVLHDVTGKPVRMVGAMIDLTARKRAEEERERLVAELQHVNGELQQFAYIVSHDLTEPLRTINNFVQLLARRLRGKLDATSEEDMAFVTDASRRMQQMLADLLAYTRIGQAPEFRAVDCEEVLMRVLGALQSQIAECGAVITHDPLPTVQGEATRLGQVVQNLIGNALKFCGPTAPRVHVSARRGEGHWEFSVRDNGIGIDPAQTGRVFEVFQRLHARDEYPGTGIGLAICKKIVEQHGGRIWVESEPGTGATFFFALPADEPGP
jgi:PAS domain S-box-containing protein